ncbi:MAG: 50S ribosomal protein L35 [Candidatus Yanofskybacteria bacterium]|nr:50S ribosomal protein L35 [Candidatus Yanofskybacteria bacterium]
MSKTHKSNRSLAKRIKITGTGKVLKRKPGQNHFNAKDSGSTGLHKHGQKGSPVEFAKSFQKLLPSRHISSEQ